MRISRLDLLAFGPFTDRTIDFGDEPALHIILGRNEAGKSSALRAIGDLLYGIPVRTTDDFRHQMKEMRIGAALVGAVDSGSLEIVRRKGSGVTLLAPGGEPIDEAVLGRLLGGVDRRLFEAQFGLSHSRLVQGGEDLLAGRGNLGQALFGAGTGSTGVTRLLAELQAEADALFRPRGSTQAVNAAIGKIEDARRRQREASLRPTEWKQVSKEHDDARAARQQLDAELDALRLTEARLDRLKGVFPLLHQRSPLLVERQLLGLETLVTEDDAAARAKASGALETALVAQTEHKAKVAALEKKRAELAVPTGLREHGAEIALLQERLGGYLEAGVDLPVKVGELRTLERAAQDLARSLFGETDLESVAARRLHPKTHARIVELGLIDSAIAARRRAAEEALASTVGELTRVEEDILTAPQPEDVSALSFALDAARAAGDVEVRLGVQEETVAGLDAKAAAAISALGLGSADLAAVEALQVPLRETVARFELEWGAALEKRGLAAQRSDAEAARLVEIDRRIAALQAGSELPDEAALATARDRRERGWRLVRSAWLEGSRNAAVEAEYGGALPLETAYEGSVQSADTVADRRQVEAERVGQLSSLAGDRTDAVGALGEADADVVAADQELVRLGEEWAALWTPVGVAALPPAEMRAWQTEHRLIVGMAEQRRTQNGGFELIRATREGHRAALLMALGEDDGVSAQDTLSRLVERSAVRVNAGDEARRVLEGQLQKAEELRLARARDEQKVEGAEKERSEWTGNWVAAIADLGLSGGESPAQAQATLARVVELFGQIDEAVTLRGRITGMEGRREQFAQAATELAQGLVPELSQRPVEDIVPALGKLAISAAAAAELDEQIAEVREALKAAEVDGGRAASTLEVLVARASCKDLDALVALERESADARRLDTEILALESQAVSAGARPILELLEEADATSLDAVLIALPKAARDIAELAEQSKQLSVRIGQLDILLAQMDGSSKAADAAETAEEAIASVSRDAEEYIRLKLAAVLLGSAVDRYREETQGPLIRRVAEIFPALTAGSFAAVAIDYDAKGQPILVGVRADGERVGVDGLSDGTRDQLYLALRVASLELHAAAADPLPLVADDLFINFDEERSAAGLEMLSRLAMQMQVMFFTHHKHLVEIAEALEAAAPTGRLRVHELDAA